ncbi:hypothetical protein PMAA_027550 [Paecilomyces variotii No. 5]|uniref:MYND-type domain-containing protein n=1 Tax=Byssochlamys spectabilis (strain No. 5 / NBRC 109023) TaxID=1356009 RepID=V5G0I5_BYSSN|nr:hypothetical protein PMAA_027550 [Paecilomyces variotii No. 5]
MNIENAKESMLSVLAPAQPQPNTRACSARNKPEPSEQQTLKRCARCQATMYCSRECQKAHWKAAHKSQCVWFAIRNHVYLDSLPEDAAMEQLIDAYRLRVEDDYAFRGDAHGLLDMDDDPMADFEFFLDLAEETEDEPGDVLEEMEMGEMGEMGEQDPGSPKRPGILPKWWCWEKRLACEEKAMRDPWSSVEIALDKNDVREHYKDNIMPMKLRMLAETVYGFNAMTF